MPAGEEGPVHEVLIKCEEVVKEEMGETENEAKTGEIGMKEESGKRQIHEAKYKYPPDRNPKILYKFNSTRWGAQQRKN